MKRIIARLYITIIYVLILFGLIYLYNQVRVSRNEYIQTSIQVADQTREILETNWYKYKNFENQALTSSLKKLMDSEVNIHSILIYSKERGLTKFTSRYNESDFLLNSIVPDDPVWNMRPEYSFTWWQRYNNNIISTPLKINDRGYSFDLIYNVLSTDKVEKVFGDAFIIVAIFLVLTVFVIIIFTVWKNKYSIKEYDEDFEHASGMMDDDFDQPLDDESDFETSASFGDETSDDMDFDDTILPDDDTADDLDDFDFNADNSDALDDLDDFGMDSDSSDDFEMEPDSDVLDDLDNMDITGSDDIGTSDDFDLDFGSDDTSEGDFDLDFGSEDASESMDDFDLDFDSDEDTTEELSQDPIDDFDLDFGDDLDDLSDDSLDSPDELDLSSELGDEDDIDTQSEDLDDFDMDFDSDEDTSLDISDEMEDFDLDFGDDTPTSGDLDMDSEDDFDIGVEAEDDLDLGITPEDPSGELDDFDFGEEPESTSEDLDDFDFGEQPDSSSEDLDDFDFEMGSENTEELDDFDAEFGDNMNTSADMEDMDLSPEVIEESSNINDLPEMDIEDELLNEDLLDSKVIKDKAEIGPDLSSQLEKAAVEESELSVVVLQIAGDDLVTHYDFITDNFGDTTTVYELDSRKIVISMTSTNSAQAVKSIGTFLETAKEQNLDMTAGISSTSQRRVGENRLLGEAIKASEKAVESTKPLIAFRPDPEKYKDFIKNS